MRNLLRCLAALAALAALESPAAEAEALWSVSTLSARGGALVPAPVRSTATDGNGDLIVVANQGDPANACIVTLKYQRGSGVIAWRQELCGANTLASAVAVDSRGDAVIMATTGGAFRLFKYAGDNGRLVWDRRSSNGGETGFSLAIDGNGDVVMLGAARAATMDLWIAKHRGADGTLMWQQPVEAGADIAPAGLALDASGNALVAGSYRNSRGDDDWHLAKLAGSSGAILWRKVYDSGARDVASAIAVDANGHVIVAGTATGTQAAIAVVKSDGATGRTLWQRTYAAGARAGASHVAFDPGNNVVVAGYVSSGSGNDLQVVKFSEIEGALLWHMAQAGGGGNANARSVTTDAAGDTLVVGTTFAGAPEIRTTKLSGLNGAPLWTVAHRSATPSMSDSGHAVAAAGSTYYAVGVSTEPQGTGLRVILYRDRVAAPLQPLRFNVQGLWWRGPEESGWGINITQQGDVLFATWFTYDDEGQPQWLVMSDGRRSADGTFTGALYRTRGPAFNQVPFNPAAVTREEVGKATLRFNDGNTGSLSYEVGSARGEKAITRQVFSSPMPQCVQGGSSSANPNFQDLWWAPNGAESGWGVNIAHQGDILFLTWFTYAADGRGTWLVASKVERTGSNTYVGTLYRTVGPPLTMQPWSASRVGVAAAGEVRLAFTDPNNATFSYTLDGVTQSKAVTRQVYATPKTVCR